LQAFAKYTRMLAAVEDWGMVQRVATVAFEGIDARTVDVQVQVAPGLPAFKKVGTINPGRDMDPACLTMSAPEPSHTFECPRISRRRATANAGSWRSRGNAPELSQNHAHHSIATDWFDFGVLACEVFGFEIHAGPDALSSLRTKLIEVEWLSISERRVLYELLEPEPDRRLAQSTTVLQALSEALSSVRSRTVSHGRSLFVGLLLGPNSRLSEAIADITKGKGDIHPSFRLKF
jgi:hypothetical protein